MSLKGESERETPTFDLLQDERVHVVEGGGGVLMDEAPAIPVSLGAMTLPTVPVLYPW